MAKRFIRSTSGNYKNLTDKSEYINGSIIFNELESAISAFGKNYIGVSDESLDVKVENGENSADVKLFANDTITATTELAGQVKINGSSKYGKKIIVSGDADNNQITLEHETITTTLIPETGEPTAANLSNGDEFQLYMPIEYVNGHVTKLEKKAYKLNIPAPVIPDVPEYDITTQSSTTNAKVILTKDNSVDSTITISGGDNVTVTSDDEGNVSIVSKDEKTTLSGHYTPTANTASELNTTDATSKGGLTAGESTVITGFKIERDEKGHVVGVVAEKGTLPEGLKIDDVEIGNGKVSLQIASVEDTSFTLNQTGNATFNIPSASDDKYGVIKIGYQSSDKNYAVDLDENGNAFVNVDWKNDDTKCTSLSITANTASVPETDTVDVIAKQDISASGSGTSLTGAINSVSVPTKKYVDSAIENGIKDLGSVLEFKGDATTLPVTAEKGDVYIVTTPFDIYENGDLIIYDGSKWISVNANWTATDGSAQLEWGTTTTLATIGGVTIDATLPSNPNTDTKVKNTSSASKVFILGQSEQDKDATEAFTNALVYMESGKLYSEGYEVINSDDWEWGFI